MGIDQEHGVQTSRAAIGEREVRVSPAIGKLRSGRQRRDKRMGVESLALIPQPLEEIGSRLPIQSPFGVLLCELNNHRAAPLRME